LVDHGIDGATVDELVPLFLTSDRQQISRIVEDTVNMIANGIKVDIAVKLLQLRIEFSRNLDDAGFRFDNPVSFQSPEVSRPFMAKILNGISGRVGIPAIQDEKSIPEIGDRRISEVLAELTYTFVGDKGGNLTLLHAFFLCHYNFESGSWGPFGSIMKVFIASSTNIPIEQWQWFGADGSDFKTSQEFEQLLVGDNPELQMVKSVPETFGRRRPLFD
jgi:hypothetical protein